MREKEGEGRQTDKLSKGSELKIQEQWREMKCTMRYSKGKKNIFSYRQLCYASQ